MRGILIAVSSVLVAGLLAGCGSEGPESEPGAREKEGAMELKSSAFENGGRIPALYTCDGDDISPPLQITGVPQEAESLALVMDDPDAPEGTFDHWIVWNIPADTTAVPEGKEPKGVVGRNGFGNLGYGGPCPPRGTHSYRFKLYALDAALDLTPGSSKKRLEKAMRGHILAEALLEGRYSRQEGGSSANETGSAVASRVAVLAFLPGLAGCPGASSLPREERSVRLRAIPATLWGLSLRNAFQFHGFVPTMFPARTVACGRQVRRREAADKIADT